MQNTPEPEVLFCDLCNTSVPQQDLDAGNAIRHEGKVLGACCLADIRGPQPGSTAKSEGRLLPVAFVLLAALATATVFLDHRLSDEAQSAQTEISAVSASVRSHAERFGDLERGLESTASSAEVKKLGEALSAQKQAIDLLEKHLQATTAEQGSALGSLREEVGALRDGRPDYMPALDRIHERVEALAVALAELRAMPRAEPREAVMEPVAPVRSGGASELPPELAHQVTRLTDPDAGTRFEAVDELLRSKNPRVLEHLVPMAQDSDIFVRRLTVEGLRQFHAAAAVEILLVALADPEEIVRDTAWRSLKELTGQSLPFEATGNKDARTRAQQRWQDWWEKNKDAFGG